jgi:hypothetical protein
VETGVTSTACAVYAGAAADTRLLIARVQTATALAITNIRIVNLLVVQVCP